MTDSRRGSVVLSPPSQPAPSTVSPHAVSSPPHTSSLSSLCEAKYPPISVESYNAYVGSGLLLRLPLHIRQLAPASMYVMITDSNVFPLYGSQLVDAFAAQGLTLHHLVLPPGEASKTRQTKAQVEDFLLSLQCGRDSCLLALGGGVIGDLTGFVAATYMRGIAYLQLPSSLLAMVDSSIGGKTGIDAPRGKNLIGAFHRPRAVIIDTSLLSTLPVREIGNGMAEVIKAGSIADEALFSLCESSAEKVMTTRDTAVLTELIYRAVQFKARVVTTDEREGGLRSILNFGHSIGHAVEAIAAVSQPRLPPQRRHPPSGQLCDRLPPAHPSASRLQRR
jgi:pentafunctional AROM polypeptide